MIHSIFLYSCSRGQIEEITKQFSEAKERLNNVNACMKSLATLCKVIDLFHNDVKRGFQVDTRNLIGSAIMEVLFKPIKFRLTSRFPRLTSL